MEHLTAYIDNKNLPSRLPRWAPIILNNCAADIKIQHMDHTEVRLLNTLASQWYHYCKDAKQWVSQFSVSLWKPFSDEVAPANPSSAPPSWMYPAQTEALRDAATPTRQGIGVMITNLDRQVSRAYADTISSPLEHTLADSRDMSDVIATLIQTTSTNNRVTERIVDIWRNNMSTSETRSIKRFSELSALLMQPELSFTHTHTHLSINGRLATYDEAYLAAALAVDTQLVRIANTILPLASPTDNNALEVSLGNVGHLQKNIAQMHATRPENGINHDDLRFMHCLGNLAGALTLELLSRSQNSSVTSSTYYTELQARQNYLFMHQHS